MLLRLSLSGGIWMIKSALSTLFAPAERVRSDEVRSQCEKLAGNRLIGTLLDSFPEPAMILNRERQIVLANDKLAAVLNRPAESLLGLRPGQALDCVHSKEGPAGCGTTHSSCQFCGALRAFVDGQRTAQPDVEECRIQRTVGGATGRLTCASGRHRWWSTANRSPCLRSTIRRMKSGARYLNAYSFTTY